MNYSSTCSKAGDTPEKRLMIGKIARFYEQNIEKNR